MSRKEYSPETFREQRKLLIEVDERLPELANLPIFGEPSDFSEYLRTLAQIKVMLISLLVQIETSKKRFDDNQAEDDDNE